MPRMHRVVDHIVECLASIGVDHIFGVDGANIEDLYDAAHFRSGITAILAKHEFSAATMADGYSRSGAGLGVVAATSGGGALNLVAGLGEETVFRGYLFERLGKLLGASLSAKIVTVLITASIFGSLHYFDQGLTGVQQATIVGLIFGTIFAVTGRIWMLISAHAAFDLTAAALIYWNLESRVAHLIFK